MKPDKSKTEGKTNTQTPNIYYMEKNSFFVVKILKIIECPVVLSELKFLNIKGQMNPQNELICDLCRCQLSSVDVDRALFQPFPSRLVFQNFSPGQTYRLPLELFNHDKVSRAVRLEPDDSQYFHAVCSDDGSQTVAPGLRATFSVVFSPQENKDYHHRLVFVTERERFEVPVVAIGPRAVLDFRDQLVLPTCPVKATTETTQLVRNIGNSQARFKLRTNRPFSVAPSSGSLDVGDSVQVTVTFNPMNVGNHRQDLILHYHTGEDVYISVSGTCQELDIHLSSDSVALKRTYITLTSVQTVSLTNTSQIPLRYIWTSEEEAAKRECRPAAVRCLPLPLPPPAPRDDRRQTWKDDLDALSDGCITAEPMVRSSEGEIWPNLTAQFHIVFKPEEAKLYQQTIYCDITGRESGLPLTIEGEGVGPNVELNYSLWDMENVVINDKLCYEVLVSNRGLINAPFSLLSPNTAFGCCFSFSPEEGVVPAGEHRIVKVTFHSRVFGSFSEDLQLRVEGKPEPLTLTFRGCVTGPSLHFDVSELSFGDVAFGFPQTSVCTLFNTSLVPVNFSLRVLGDGVGPPSITCVKQVHEAFRDQWHGSTARDVHSQPVEFTVSPCYSIVTLCSNTVKRYRLTLAVDVEGVGKEVLTLPISARLV
uniref:HYDIN/VesB/CFA65-like Ig-like domain-containing protein n=1 Tax=Sphaeramia orbicularis TaxID=375764 RepID=A0A672ZM34_9TELE